jgi:hypothetical protein
MYVRIGNLGVCSIDGMQSAKSGVSRVLGLLSIKTACLRQAVRHCHVLTVTVSAHCVALAAKMYKSITRYLVSIIPDCNV